MKFLKPNTCFILLLAPLFTAGEQIIMSFWHPQNVPAAGLSDITFPMSMVYAPHQSGYFFEQSIGFMHGSGPVYTGIQPREDRDGQSIVHAVFSSFIKGTTTTDKNCGLGADASPDGVSCSVEVPATYNTTYHLEIKNAGGSSWTGTLIDAGFGNQWHIGTFELPSTTYGMTAKYAAFVEYYFSALGQCVDFPQTSVIFGTPMTTTPGVTITMETPFATGPCKGKFPISVQSFGNGYYEVDVGN